MDMAIATETTAVRLSRRKARHLNMSEFLRRERNSRPLNREPGKPRESLLS